MPASRLSLSLASMAMPVLCEVCNCTLAPGESTICTACLAAMPRTFAHRSTFNELHRRLGHRHPVDRAAGWFAYSRQSKQARLLIKAKYADRPAIAYDLAFKFAQELIADGFFRSADILVPAPMHWTKRLRRGYNQALVICQGIAAATGLPISQALSAPMKHSIQSRLGRLGRYVNISGTMSLSRHAADVRGRHVILVDDIITTGATLTECIATLATAAPASVSVLTLGVTR